MDQPLHRGHRLQLDPAVFGCHTVRLPGGDVVICVHGEIDCFTAPTLQACLDQQFTAPSRAGGVEVALAHTTFVGARGISTLLAAVHTARLQATAFRITGCSPQLLRVIDIVGLSDVLAASLERPRHSGLGDCPSLQQRPTLSAARAADPQVASAAVHAGVKAALAEELRGLG